VISGGLIVIAYRRIWASLHRARANESRARRALQQVEELAATLEVRVAERTSELRVANEELENSIAEVQTTQGQLMEASRLAGKAEVASGVLHNVGNILTSVGVSSAQIQSTTEASRLPSLVRAVDLLASQERPGAFLDEDPRGERLIEFLVAVGSRLTEEQAAISEKARLLDQKTEHMRAVIQMQQAHARASTVLCEEVEIGEVVDQAIALNQAVSGTTPFPIVRESDDHPPVLLDRHRLIQVLVNLIRNALQAIESTGRGGTVTVLTTQETQLRIVVADDGCGITEEDLPKVFELGFTTRPDGHGIGLHASACAILEMGGEMRVESEGPGLGASFTILLPLHEGSAVQDAPLAAVG